MATHDYVIDNSTGANVRADINNVLQAILTNNSSSSAPSTTAAYMWWADTTNGVLKIRNSANNAWVELLQLDGTLTLEDGSASSPALSFRDDLNTGVFSSAADTFNVATGGVERMELGTTTIFNEDGADVDFRIEGDTKANLFYVDASTDQIGINTNSPNQLLHLAHASGSTILELQRTDTNTTGGVGMINFTATDGHSVGSIGMIGDGNDEGGDIIFKTTSAAANNDPFNAATPTVMTIDSSGNVGIGITPATGLSIGKQGTVLSGTGNNFGFYANVISSGYVYLDAVTGSSNNTSLSLRTYNNGTYTQVIQSISGNQTTFETAGLERARIDSNGKILVGHSTDKNSSDVNNLLQVFTAAGAKILLGRDDSSVGDGDFVGMIDFHTTDGTSSQRGARIGAIATHGHADDDKPTALVFQTCADASGSADEKMRIGSNGVIGIGTTSPRDSTGIHLSKSGGECILEMQRSGVNTTGNVGMINFTASDGHSVANMGAFGDGDNEGAHLIFKTTTAASANSPYETNTNERLKIHGGGDFTFNGCTTTINSSNYGLYFLNDSNSTKSIFIQHSREANGTHSTAEFYGNQGQFRINGDGDVQNTNNSYGAISDETLKQDIVDASSQWNDIKAIKVRKFRFKDNPTGDLHIGVVAQELETVSPKLVTELATSSEDLTSTETVKSVKYSVLYMKAIKALQEAQTRIETLETKVAALEAA